MSIAATPQDFGTVGQGGNDLAVFQDFLDAVPYGFIPPGRYNIEGSLEMRDDQEIFGAPGATLVYTEASPPANNAFIKFGAISNSRLKGVELEVDYQQYPTTRSVQMSNSEHCHIKGLSYAGAGGYAVQLLGATDCSAKDLKIDNYAVRGGHMNADCVDCTFSGFDIPDASNSGGHGIQTIGGAGIVIKENRIRKTPDSCFGIHMFECQRGKILNNDVGNTRREAIALFGVYCEVAGNNMWWSENLGVGDFGFSMQGASSSRLSADNIIHSNTIVNSALCGIGLAGDCQRNLITQNIIRDCGRIGSGALSDGIRIYNIAGATINQKNRVTNNMFVKIGTGGMANAARVDSPASGVVIDGNHRVAQAMGFSIAGTNTVLGDNW